MLEHIWWSQYASFIDSDNGAAYVYDLVSGTSSTYTQLQRLYTGANNAFFGFAVSISGNTIIVGAFQEGK